MLITNEKINSCAERALRRHAEYKMTNVAFRAWDTAYCFDVIDPKPGMKILEVGSGGTHSYLAFHDAGADLHVTDSMEWQARRQREIDAGRVPQTGLPDIDIQQLEANAAGITAFKLDIQDHRDCPDPEIYDAVYSISAIEHTADAMSSLKNIFRILKPGGVFAVTAEFNMTDSMPFIGDPLYIAIFFLNDFIKILMDTGFEVHDISPQPDHLHQMYQGKGGGNQLLYSHFFGNIGIAAIKPIGGTSK